MSLNTARKIFNSRISGENINTDIYIGVKQRFKCFTLNQYANEMNVIYKKDAPVFVLDNIVFRNVPTKANHNA